MKLNFTFILILAFFLIGCAGTQSHLRVLEANGAIKVDVSDSKEYDYKVVIKNSVDFGWDGGKEEDRIKTVQMMFKDSCSSVDVIDQTPIKTGTYLTGKESVTWVMKVKCIKGSI